MNKLTVFGEKSEKLNDSLFRLSDRKIAENSETIAEGKSYWESTIHCFFNDKVAVAMLLVIVVMLLFSFIQPYLPGQHNPSYINNDPITGFQLVNSSPNSEFWLGTNNIGQDLWARIWAGTRTSLMIGFTVAVFRSLLGVFMGFVWGYVKRLDGFFTELYNVIANVPSTIVLMLATYILQPGIFTMIVSMCATGWLGVARFVRNQVIMVRDSDFNRASRCLGTPFFKIIMRNLLPHTLSVIILQFVLSIPSAIGSEVFLTYIGLGLPVEYPSLGNLVNTGRMLVMSSSLRYQFYFPCMVLSIITVCFYILGNSFADAADPKNH